MTSGKSNDAGLYFIPSILLLLIAAKVSWFFFSRRLFDQLEELPLGAEPMIEPWPALQLQTGRQPASASAKNLSYVALHLLHPHELCGT
jgi:hypothetical protein